MKYRLWIGVPIALAGGAVAVAAFCGLAATANFYMSELNVCVAVPRWWVRVEWLALIGAVLVGPIMAVVTFRWYVSLCLPRPNRGFIRSALLVLGIFGLAVLIELAVPSWLASPIEYSKRMRVCADIQTLKKRVNTFREVNGTCPSSEKWLHEIGPDFRDPWGSSYIYRHPGKRCINSYDLFSSGPDRVPDTADDDWGCLVVRWN